MRRLEFDTLKADLAAVSGLLEHRSEDEDPIGHLQLTARKSELESEIARLQQEHESRASVALYFGGRPVVGSRGTEVARGSFGFVLEEAEQNDEPLETRLKQVVADISEMIYHTSQVGDQGFEDATEMLDDRLLISLRTFFKTLDDAGATMRLLDAHREVVLHLSVVVLAA